MTATLMVSSGGRPATPAARIVAPPTRGLSGRGLSVSGPYNPRIERSATWFRPLHLPFLFGFALASTGAVAYLRKYLEYGRGSHVGVALGLAAVAVLCVFALRWRPAVQRHLAVFLVTTIFGLYGSELALGWSAAVRTPRETRACMAEDAGVSFDARSRRDVVLDERAQGGRWYPTVSPRHFYGGHELTIDGRAVLPLGGVPLSGIVNCNENGYFATFRSDEYGFNNPPGSWEGDEPFDVFLVGDSFTVGSCVRPGESFADLVRARWPRTLNLGSTANGPLAELACLREYLRGRRARVVLWAYVEENDLADLFDRELSEPILRRYLEPDFSQGLVGLQDRLGPALEAFVADAMEVAGAEEEAAANRGLMDTLVDRLSLARVRTLLFRARRALDPAPRRTYDLEPLREVLALARDEAKRAGARLALVYLPEFHRYAATEGNSSASHLQAGVRAVAASLGFDYVDVPAAFARNDNPRRLFPFGLHGHYDAAGHALVAQEILAYLER